MAAAAVQRDVLVTKKKAIIFSVEGNIGAGKSTIFKMLKEHLRTIKNTQVVYLPEPVSVWESIKDSDGENAIEKYYGNPVKYAFPFQMMAFISRIHQLREALKSARGNVIIISERSVLTDKVVFTKMLYEDNKIGGIEYNIYCKWFNEFVEDIPHGGLIYIKTKPEICGKRVIKRNRKGETIPLAYLQNCHKYHEEWLNNESLPVLQLDGKFIDQSCLETIEIFIESLMTLY